MTIDYRKRKHDVSVALPTALVWFTGLSLSVPEFVLSSTLKFGKRLVLCTIIDVYYGKLLQILLVVFRVVIPVPLFLLLTSILAIRLCQSAKSQKDVDLTKKEYKIESVLLFAVVLSLTHISSSFQRDFFYLLHVVKQAYDGESSSAFLTPPLHNLYLSKHANTYLSMLNYIAGTTRPFLYLFLLPKFKALVKSKICMSKQNKI